MENPYRSPTIAKPAHSAPHPTGDAPGWLTFLVALVALFYPVVYTYVYFVAVAGAAQSVQQIVYGGGKALQFALPLLWVGWLWLRGVPRRNPAEIEPEAPFSLRKSLAIGVGFALATVLAVGLIGGLWLLPAGFLDVAGRAIREKIAQFGITTPGRYFALAIYYSVVHSFLEEYYWRWFAFRLVRRFAPLIPAALISGIAFAAHHVLVLGIYFGWTSPLAWLTGGSVAVGGAFWAWLYARSGRLWIAWLSHTIIDLGVFAMGYWMIL
jgi:membrane protease YdiL (CAAX protease family)